MRQKSANEKAIKKLLQYLEALHSKCDGNPNFKGISGSQLQSLYNINKSTYAACRELGIIIEHEDYIEWNSENPTRETALRILDNLLHRRKKPTADVPILPDFVTPLNAIVEKLTSLSKNNFNRLEPLKTPQKEQSLFSDQEKTAQLRHELITGIATGIYKDWEALTDYQAVNHRIITAADHLLSLYNKK